MNKPKSPALKDIINEKKNPNDVVNAARASQDAKEATETGASESKDFKLEALKEKPTAKADDKSKAPSKRLSRKKWIEILAHKDRDGLTASEIAEEYSVSENNVYQWSSKLKAEQEASKQPSKPLGDNDIVANAQKMLDGVDGQLEAFDKRVEDAKALVANSDKERKEIEGKKKKYQTIIDLLGDKK